MEKLGINSFGKNNPVVSKNNSSIIYNQRVVYEPSSVIFLLFL